MSRSRFYFFSFFFQFVDMTPKCNYSRNRKKSDRLCNTPIHQGSVVRKPVNTNPGLNFNQGSYFSCLKEFSLLKTTGRLKATKVKTFGIKGSTGILIAWLQV